MRLSCVLDPFGANENWARDSAHPYFECVNEAFARMRYYVVSNTCNFVTLFLYYFLGPHGGQFLDRTFLWFWLKKISIRPIPVLCSRGRVEKNDFRIFSLCFRGSALQVKITITRDCLFQPISFFYFHWVPFRLKYDPTSSPFFKNSLFCFHWKTFGMLSWLLFQ